MDPYYTPLVPPTTIIDRHLFWSNFHIGPMQAPKGDGFIMKTNLAGRKEMQDFLGIHFDEHIYIGNNHCPVQVLRNCVHPEMGLHIMNWATGAIKDQDDLFGEMG